MEHLPECEAYRNEVGGGCICHHVRACEQRVREEENRNVIGSVSLAAIGEANLQQYQLGFSEGLDAAREAVERVSSLLQPLGPALAAIDALREEQAPPPLPPSVGVPSKPMWPLREEQK